MSTPSHAVSPLAIPFPVMPAIAGVTVRVARARYKEWDRCDLTFAEFTPGTTVAGVTTQSKCPSPEVEWCRDALVLGQARALIVNAGNSNAFTGHRGRAAVEALAARAAMRLGCQPSDVFVASTGVIGVPLPVDKAEAGLDAAFVAPVADWRDAAATIGTTDTFEKGATATAIVDGRTITIAAIIKGSGMIAPDMATMLAYVATDGLAGVVKNGAVGIRQHHLISSRGTDLGDAAAHGPGSDNGDPFQCHLGKGEESVRT